jgi:hypothetical protein
MDLRTVAFLFVAIIGVVVVSPVHADSGETRPSLIWHVQNFVYDIREAVSFDPDKKAQLLSNHIESIQTQIDKKISNNEPIPQAYEERRLTKIVKLETQIDKIEVQEQTGIVCDGYPDCKVSKLQQLKNNLLDNVNNFKALKDHNEIRTCVSDFYKLRIMTSDAAGSNIMMETLAKNIDDKCNALPSAKELCTSHVSSLDLAFSKNPYGDLQNHCPTLKSIPMLKAQSLFNGEN